MASKKSQVRDARFRDRESASPQSQGSPSVRPQSSGRQAPSGSRPSTVRPPPAPSPSGPAWLNANLVIPAVLALGLGAVGLWYYKSQHPDTAAAPTGATAGTDGGVADGSVPVVASGNSDAGRAGTDAAADAPTAVAAAPAGDGGAAAPLNGDPVEPAHPEPTAPDPRHGQFSLADATAGLTGTGSLVAEIETSMGSFTCALLSQEAPNTVANFVGLARGTRDFWDPVAGQWARRPFYDGSIFHRVIPDFMIQGGDLLRSGTGGTGYEIADENVSGHNAAGQLCMANHGPNTNGGQFFITEAAKPHLDGSYSIFGRCTPTALVGTIARVETRGSRPATPVFIQHVRIRHGA